MLKKLFIAGLFVLYTTSAFAFGFGGGGGGSRGGIWGHITGTLASQTDLANAIKRANNAAGVPDSVAVDEMGFRTTGTTFAPIIVTTGSPTVLWSFDDGTTSTSESPSHTYSSGTHITRLKVTPWSGLVGVNIGYGADDFSGHAYSAPEAMTSHDQQNVTAVYNLYNVAPTLQWWASSRNTGLVDLDFSNFTALTDIENFASTGTTHVHLANNTTLKRLCVESNAITSEIDLSQAPVFQDLRGSDNNTALLKLSPDNTYVTHWCAWGENHAGATIQDLSGFANLYELWINDSGWGGSLHTHSTHLEGPWLTGNSFTSIDIENAANLGTLDVHGMTTLTSVSLPGTTRASTLNFNGCTGLDQTDVDGILATVDGWNTSNGTLNLGSTAVPSTTGQSHVTSLEGRGWTVTVDEQVSYAAPAYVNGNQTLRLTLDHGNLSTSSPVTLTQGNVVAVAVTSWGNGNFTGVTDSLGNTYTHVTGADTNGGDSHGFTSWYVAPVTTGGSATITAVDGNAQVTYSSVTVLQFSGVDTTNPVDVSGHHDGYAATETVTGFSTNYATDVILQASHHNDVAAGTYTVAPSGMTLAYGDASISPDRPVYYQVQSSTQSSIGVGLTCGSGTTYGMAVIALRPAVQ